MDVSDTATEVVSRKRDCDQRGVITSHPGKHVAVYHAVHALYKDGQLRRHLAAIYYDPRLPSYRLLSLVTKVFGPGFARRLERRQMAAVDPRLITSFPYVEVLLRAIALVPFTRRLRLFARSYLVVDRVHDWFAAAYLWVKPAPRIFYGYQGSANRSLGAARRKGAIAVLDLTHPLDHRAIVAEEMERLRLTSVSDWDSIESTKFVDHVGGADYCITASAMSTDSLLRIGFPRERIFEMAYGIDLQRFRPSSETRSDDVFRVAYVAKLSVHKGFHYLLEAWRDLGDFDRQLVMVGTTTQPADEELLRRHSLERVVVTSYVEDIHDIFRSSDVFCLPSLMEGFGMATLEAMASGLPVVVSENARCVVRDGVDGFVVPIRDAAALREKLRTLQADPQLRRMMGANARRRAEEFPWERFYDQFAHVFRGIAERGTRRPEADRGLPVGRG